MFKKKMLDYLAIPASASGTKKQREKRALKELKKRRVKNVLLLDGKDSEEDILYLGRLLKKGDRIGFDTFPLHYKEYKEIIKKAKKQGKFPKGIKIENIRTSQSFKQTIYGFLGSEEEKIEKGEIKYMKDRNKFFLWLKGVVKKIINLF